MSFFDDLKDLGDKIKSPFVDAVNELGDTAKTVVRAVADVGITIGDGIADAGRTVGNGIVNFGRDAERWTVSAAGTVVDFSKTSAGEVADWTENAAGDVAHFAESAYREVRNVAEVAWNVIKDLFFKELPELDDPSDEAKLLAQIMFPGVSEALSAAARAGGFTMGFDVNGSAGIGIGVQGRAGLYVDSTGSWGFFKLKVPDPTLKTGAEADLDVYTVFGSRERFSGTRYLKLGVKANFGVFKAEADMLIKESNLSFLGFMLGAGITAKVPDANKDASKPSKVDPLKFKLSSSTDPKVVLSAMGDIAPSWDLATRVKSGVESEERGLTTANAAAYQVFQPTAYGFLTTAADPGAVLYIENGSDLTLYANGVVGSPQGPFALRLVAGLANPEGVTLELPGNPPRYLAVVNSDIELSQYQNSDAFRASATFRLCRGHSDPRGLSFATFENPPRFIYVAGFETLPNGVNEATLILMAPSAEARWNTHTTFHITPQPVPVAQCSFFSSGQTLGPGEYRRSPNGRYFMTMTPEGRLMVGTGAGPQSVTGFWPAGTPSIGNGNQSLDCYAELQSDGELLVRRSDSGSIVYSSNVHKSGAADAFTQHFLAVTNAGELGIFQGTPDHPAELIWTTVGHLGAVNWVKRRRTVALQTAPQRYITADNGGTEDFSQPYKLLRLDTQVVGRHEIFSWEELWNGKVALRSSRRQYAASRSNEGQNDVAVYLGDILDWAMYSVTSLGDGQVQLRDIDGGVLCRGGAGQVQALGGEGATPLAIKVVELGVDPVVNSGRVYTLQAMHSGLFLEVEGRSRSNGAHLVQNPENGSDSQLWTITYLEDGTFSITSVLSGQCVEVGGALVTAGAGVNQWPYSGLANQRFKLLPADDGQSFHVAFMHTGLFLDVSGGSMTAGTRLIQSTAHYGPNQRFRLQLARPRVRSVVPLKVLVHVQNVGDLTVNDDQRAGVEPALRVEGMQINVQSATAVPGLALEVMGHIQDVGDTQWQSADTFLGTRGMARRLEGFAIRLKGPEIVTRNYSVWYKALILGGGETADCTNGEFCGTRGQSRALGWIQVWIRKRSS